MRRLGQLAVVLAAGLAMGGCASSMSVSSHVDRSVDLARYRTYDWGPADALPTGDPRLDQSPFFRDHLQGAVEKQLAAKGLAIATTGAPDLLIHYHANVSRRIDANTVDRGRGYCFGDDCRAGAGEYEAGTIVLDFVDARTRTVIWRGWAQDSLEGVIDNPDKLERTINEAVPRMLARFRKDAGRP